MPLDAPGRRGTQLISFLYIFHCKPDFLSELEISGKTRTRSRSPPHANHTVLSILYHPSHASFSRFSSLWPPMPTALRDKLAEALEHEEDDSTDHWFSTFSILGTPTKPGSSWILLSWKGLGGWDPWHLEVVRENRCHRGTLV